MGLRRYGVRQYTLGVPATVERGFFFAKQGYIGDIQDEGIGEEEDEDSRTEIIQSVSTVGDMVDFLKANPFVTMEAYIWDLNPALISIMSADNTHVRYLSEKQQKKRKSKVVNGYMLNDLGIPIIG